MRKKILIIYIVLMHLALLAVLFAYMSSKNKLNDAQLGKTVKSEAFERCVTETQKINDCSTINTWYINNSVKLDDSSILYGNYFGASTQQGYTTYILVNDSGKVLK